MQINDITRYYAKNSKVSKRKREAYHHTLNTDKTVPQDLQYRMQNSETNYETEKKLHKNSNFWLPKVVQQHTYGKMGK